MLAASATLSILLRRDLPYSYISYFCKYYLLSVAVNFHHLLEKIKKTFTEYFGKIEQKVLETFLEIHCMPPSP